MFNTRINIFAILISCFCILSQAETKGFRYAEDRAPGSLNPLYADDMYSVRSIELIHAGLVGYDKELRPKMVLAQSFEKSADNSSVLIRLRNGMNWHDGKPVKADDVMFTVKAMQHPRTPSLEKVKVSFISSIVKVDELSVRVTFKKPIEKPERYFRFKILPKHKFLKPYIEPSDFFGRDPVGAGPYSFRSWSTNNKISLVRSLNSSPLPNIQSVEMQEIQDKNMQKNVQIYGGINAIIRVRPKDIPELEQIDSVELYPYTSLSWWYLALNHKNPHLKNKGVRQAIAHALDRTQIREAHLGDGDTISGPFAPASPYYNFSIKPKKYSLRDSVALIKKAGYRKKGKYFVKRGKTLGFKMIVDKSMSIYKNVSLDIQSQLQMAGIKLEIEWLTSAEIKTRVFKRKRYAAYLSRWSFDDSSIIYPLFHSKGKLNYIGYKNKIVDQLLDESLVTDDPEVFRSIYMDLHKYLHNDLPYVFLFSLIGYTSISTEVTDTIVHPFYYFSFFPEWKFSKP